MDLNHETTAVNAWNEWDPLRRVVVGRPDGGMISAPEPALMLDFPDAGIELGEWGSLPDDLVEIAGQKMDGFANLMESSGIRVDRPTPIDFGQKVAAPDWEHESSFGCMPPRGLLLPVGNEILEATMSQRSRWFEFLCYRPLLEQYYREDPDSLWEAAPKPRLTDASYEEDYWHDFYNVWTDDEKEARVRAMEWQQTEKEPLFDAADVFRSGKDLFVQRSAMTNEAGFDWLRRHFQPRGLRIHRVAFGGSHLNWHLDCTIIAPRPGLLIQNPAWPPLFPEFHDLFKINGWEIVMADPPSRSRPHPYSFCSINLAYNTFSLDPQTICVEAGEVKLMDQLDWLGGYPGGILRGFPLRGGLHCASLDIWRERGCEDDLPKQISGF
jgi:glycine amidinotransferase